MAGVGIDVHVCDELGLELVDPSHGRVKVVDLKPDRHPVTERLAGIANRAVMMLGLELMQLQDEIAIDQQLLVLAAAVTPFGAKRCLIPAAGGLDVSDSDHRLRPQGESVGIALFELLGEDLSRQFDALVADVHAVRSGDQPLDLGLVLFAERTAQRLIA